MDTAAMMAAISVLAALSGMVLGWTGKARTVRQDTIAEAKEDATIKSELQYIKRGIDDVRFEQRAQGKRFDELAERVARLEESTKQAHHRLNRLDEWKGG